MINDYWTMTARVLVGLCILPVECSFVSPDRQHGTKPDRRETGLWPNSLLNKQTIACHSQNNTQTLSLLSVISSYRSVYASNKNREDSIKRDVIYGDGYGLDFFNNGEQTHPVYFISCPEKPN